MGSPVWVGPAQSSSGGSVPYPHQADRHLPYGIAYGPDPIKILVGDLDSLHRSIVQIDIWQNDWRKIGLDTPDPNCKACGRGVYDFLDAEEEEFSAVLCGRNAVQIVPARPAELDLRSFAENLSHIEDVRQNEYLVRFSSGGNEITVFRDARAIVKGTDDIAAARSLYARFVAT